MAFWDNLTFWKPAKPKIYGFYSQKMANQGFPVYTYSTLDGFKVDVTVISYVTCPAAMTTDKWTDLTYMGELKDMLKKN